MAEIDGLVVGYVHANDYDLLYEPPMKNIMGIAVFKEYQNRGIGKMLLSSVEDWAKESVVHGIRLVSGEKRISAHKFYERCGYHSDKKQLNFNKMF